MQDIDILPHNHANPQSIPRTYTYAGTLIGPLGDSIEISGKVRGTNFTSPYMVGAAIYRALTGRALRARKSDWQVWGAAVGGWLQTSGTDPIVRARFWPEGHQPDDNLTDNNPTDKSAPVLSAPTLPSEPSE